MVTTGSSSSSASSGSTDKSVRGDSLAEAIENVTRLRISSDKDMISALTAFSELIPSEFIGATEPKRRQQLDLRTLIQAHQIKSYKKFLAAFKEVKDGVKGLETELTNLSTLCDEMATKLYASKQNSRSLIDEISKLGVERNKLLKERDLAVAYQSAFQLSSEDLKTLRGSDHMTNNTLTPEFFAVFEKVQRIQSNVAVLKEVGHHTTAIEILDQMGLFQETALERIYRWAQSQCRNVENPETADILTKAMEKLQIRPMLLKYVIDEYNNHRRSLVVRSFIDALTGVGNIKGIELIGSVDPARYIGDMLAWVHQVTPGEKDNLLILLKNCDQNDEIIQDCLATILDGVCRPLNVRIEQTILSGYDCVTINKIDLLLQFYVETIAQVVPGSNLLTTVKELQSVAHQTFLTQLNAQVEAELGELRAPSSDLTPSHVIQELLSLLKELIEPNSSPEYTMTTVLMVVSPLVSQVNAIATRLGSPDHGVYFINCMNEIIKFLKTLSNTEMLCTSYEGQIESQVDRLSAEQSSWLVAQLGIGHIYTILNEKMEDPLSSVPGMDSSSLKIFSNKLDTLIVTPESVLLPQLINISDVTTRKAIQRQSFRILVAIYKQVYEAVQQPKNQYPENILPFDPAALETALCS